jgi:hypothetical protein
MGLRGEITKIAKPHASPPITAMASVPSGVVSAHWTIGQGRCPRCARSSSGPSAPSTRKKRPMPAKISAMQPALCAGSLPGSARDGRCGAMVGGGSFPWTAPSPSHKAPSVCGKHTGNGGRRQAKLWASSIAPRSPAWRPARPRAPHTRSRIYRTRLSFQRHPLHRNRYAPPYPFAACRPHRPDFARNGPRGAAPTSSARRRRAGRARSRAVSHRTANESRPHRTLRLMVGPRDLAGQAHASGV